MRRLALLIVVCVTGLIVSAGSAAADAPTTWKLDLHHRETKFAPGGTGEYWVYVTNIGDEDSSGPVTVTLELPTGMTLESTRPNGDWSYVMWECPTAPGETTVTCTTEQSIPKHMVTASLVVTVNVDPSASGTLTATGTVDGGGAAEAATDSEPTQIGSGLPGFGIVPGSFFVDFMNRDQKTPVRKAGSHPDVAVFAFDFNSKPYPNDNLWPHVPYQKAPDENVRHLQINMPRGFLGNPTAVGECTAAQLTAGACPRNSQVGRIDLSLFPIQPMQSATTWPLHMAVYNMTHPRGAVADLAFSILGNAVHIKASLDPSDNYAVRTTISDINESLPIFDQKLTLWGVPSERWHDWDRCNNEGFVGEPHPQPCETDLPAKPFLTVPSQCGVDHSVRLSRYDSWTNTGVYGPDVVSESFQVTDCDKPRFEPKVELQPTGKAAKTPTGLDVHVVVPQSESTGGLATPTVKQFEVTFPQGMSLSPSFADGLTGCTLDQIGLKTDNPVACPGSSRIGNMELSTPLLPQPLQGSMYLSNQGENPFGSTFGVYLVAHDVEDRGVLIKLPGRLDLDKQTGQITATFDDLPQLPFDDLTLGFRSGARAPLVNPPSCGTHTIGVEIASWAQPNEPVDVSGSFEVVEGPEGAPCAQESAQRFAPRMSTGSINPAAGAFSPFVFRLDRRDVDQELGTIQATLPKGLLAKIADVSNCPDAALASISGAEGTGKQELAQPACPASSQIGTLNVGMGAGTGPNYFGGKAYMAGPYKGAPLSLAVVVPAIAGPFDFGSVVVRTALHVNPETAQVRAVSDPLPTMLHGVLLRVRDIRLKMDRSQTMINPTSCAPTNIEGRVTGLSGATAVLSNWFQVGECASLRFGPKLSLRLKGGTRRGTYPALTATLTAKPGEANIGRAAVTLPHSAFLAQENIRTVCTRVQYAAEACPPGSVYGHARAITPLLAEPLEGPVYLRSSDNPLPDLVAHLGGRVDVDLVGRIDSVNGGIRTTFAAVPDAPVTKFTLKMMGGKKSLLVNSRHLCARPNRAHVRLVGQNGMRTSTRPAVKVRCGKKGKNGKNAKRRASKARR